MYNFFHIREQKLRDRKRESRLLIEKVRDLLVNEFSAKEIYVFGSFGEDRFDIRSDLDIAVKGIPPNLFIRAFDSISNLSVDFSFDLVDLDHSSDLLKKHILTRGKLIYEER